MKKTIIKALKILGIILGAYISVVFVMVVYNQIFVSFPSHMAAIDAAAAEQQ